MDSRVAKKARQLGRTTSLFFILTLACASAEESRWDKLPDDDDCSKYDVGVDDIPGMRVKIFNDSQQHIFPVLTMGKGKDDLWMQMFYSVTEANIGKKEYAYSRDKAYRLYINPKTGIAPNQHVCITLPLFTKLVEKIDPAVANQFADWWQGGTIQLFAAYKEGGEAIPPLALDERYNNGNGGGYPVNNPAQEVIKNIPEKALKPKCRGCDNTDKDENLPIFADSADLVPSDPSQLIEYTFGAKQEPRTKGPNLPAFVLNARDVDFDVSYVNLAFLPAALGVYDNKQVGYIGSPQSIYDFRQGLKKFISDNITKDEPGSPSRKGWPQLVHTYKGGSQVELLKLPSPLEVFPSLTEPNQRTDLTALTNPPDKFPDKIWPSLQRLRDNWKIIADPDTGCRKSSNPPNNPTFCDGIVDALALLKANFDKYQCLFQSSPDPVKCVNKTKICPGTPKFTVWDQKADYVMSHFYGWTPFTESKEDKLGCGAGDNRLEKSSAFYIDLDPDCTESDKSKCALLYRPYLKAKREFDQLNYGKLCDAPNNAGKCPPTAAKAKPKASGPFTYDINPWVSLIHNKKYLGIEMAYAYSVDDAVGNIQAEGAGMVIDIASKKNLPNPNPATPPVQITLGAPDPNTVPLVSFTEYLIKCKNDDKARYKKVNPLFTTFVLNAVNVKDCPIYFKDSKGQEYTSTLERDPVSFPYDPDRKKTNWTIVNKPAEWEPKTTAEPVECRDNTGTEKTLKGYSSKVYCCNTTGKYGVYAYAQTDPANVHGALDYKVNTKPPQGQYANKDFNFNVNDETCTRGDQKLDPR